MSEAKRKFKVGDRVRFKEEYRSGRKAVKHADLSVKVCDGGEVVEFDAQDGTYKVKSVGAQFWVAPEEVELVESTHTPAQEQPVREFKKGDKVVYCGPTKPGERTKNNAVAPEAGDVGTITIAYDDHSSVKFPSARRAWYYMHDELRHAEASEIETLQQEQDMGKIQAGDRVRVSDLAGGDKSKGIVEGGVYEVKHAEGGIYIKIGDGRTQPMYDRQVIKVSDDTPLTPLASLRDYSVGDRVRVLKLDGSDAGYGVKVGGVYEVVGVAEGGSWPIHINAPGAPARHMGCSQVEKVDPSTPLTHEGEGDDDSVIAVGDHVRIIDTTDENLSVGDVYRVKAFDGDGREDIYVDAPHLKGHWQTSKGYTVANDEWKKVAKSTPLTPAPERRTGSIEADVELKPVEARRFSIGDKVRMREGVGSGETVTFGADAPRVVGEVGEVVGFGAGECAFRVRFNSSTSGTKVYTYHQDDLRPAIQGESIELTVIDDSDTPAPVLTVLPAGSVACYPGDCAGCEHFKARIVGADCLPTIVEEGLDLG